MIKYNGLTLETYRRAWECAKWINKNTKDRLRFGYVNGLYHSGGQKYCPTQVIELARDLGMKEAS